MSFKDLDEEIEKIFKKQKRALPSTTISTLTGEPIKKIDKKLKKMKKNGVIKLHKTMKLRFYRLSED